MIVLIDNYDSFTHNLYQLIGGVNPDVRVVRNDAVSVEELRQWAPAAIFLSPGPGRPADAGVCEAVVRELSGVIPIFGVCLGHQAICEVFGGRVDYARVLMHGKVSPVTSVPGSGLFEGVASPFEAARYHSLATPERDMPGCLRVTARSDDGEVMAVEHTEHLTWSVQFHPESIMTPDGETMVRNFLRRAAG